jgi:hypothetical protein
MDRSKMNVWVDALSFTASALLVSTGFLLRYLLPPGSGRVEGQGTGWRSLEKPVSLLWGFTRHQWGSFHFCVAVCLMAILSIHLFLHWRWIVAAATGRPRQESGLRAGLGLFGLAALIALSIAPFFSAIEKVRRADLKDTTPAPIAVSSEVGSREAESIRGSMTLREVERESGVPMTVLKKKLGLPASAEPDDRLGFWKRKVGFEMQDVRRIIDEQKRQSKTRGAKPCDDSGASPCTENP